MVMSQEQWCASRKQPGQASPHQVCGVLGNKQHKNHAFWEQQWGRGAGNVVS